MMSHPLNDPNPDDNDIETPSFSHPSSLLHTQLESASTSSRAQLQPILNRYRSTRSSAFDSDPESDRDSSPSANLPSTAATTPFTNMGMTRSVGTQTDSTTDTHVNGVVNGDIEIRTTRTEDPWHASPRYRIPMIRRNAIVAEDWIWRDNRLVNRRTNLPMFLRQENTVVNDAVVDGENPTITPRHRGLPLSNSQISLLDLGPSLTGEGTGRRTRGSGRSRPVSGEAVVGVEGDGDRNGGRRSAREAEGVGEGETDRTGLERRLRSIMLENLR